MGRDTSLSVEQVTIFIIVHSVMFYGCYRITTPFLHHVHDLDHNANDQDGSDSIHCHVQPQRLLLKPLLHLLDETLLLLVRAGIIPPVDLLLLALALALAHALASRDQTDTAAARVPLVTRPRPGRWPRPTSAWPTRRAPSAVCRARPDRAERSAPPRY